MEELVYLKKDQALTDSLKVAEMFGKRHDHVLRDIQTKYADEIYRGVSPKLGEPAFFETWYKNEQNGERYTKYLMNEQGFYLLAMGFTGEKAKIWKKKFIYAFGAMKQIVMERQTTAWIESRQQGKLVRKSFTDTIQKLIEYAKEQGSTHSHMLYTTYTKLASKMVGVSDRDTATNAQLNDLSTMERLIAKVVIDGMEQGKHYKDIYKESKERLETVKGWMIEVA